MNIFKKLFNRKESRTVSIMSSPGSAGVVWPQRGYENFARETYLKNVTAFRAIDEVAKSAASVPWKIFDRNEDNTRDEVIDDPFNLILKRPNPDESFAFVMLKTIAYLAMCGNAFLERNILESGPNKGQMRELYSHRPDRFSFKVSGGKLEQYIYNVGGNKTIWDVDPITNHADILQLKAFHPLDDWWGAAPTESGAREIDTSNSATEWNKSLLDNQGRPGMVFTLVGNIGQDTMDGLERHLEQRSGPSFAGKDLIITGERGTGVSPYGWSPADMDFSEGDLRLMRKIAMTYGVPPMLLGIPGEATFANYKEARLSFWETTVFWWLNYVRGELNNWLFPSDSNRFVDYILDEVPALSIKRDALWERAEKADFISINEKREMVGLDSWGEAGDVILVEASKIPLGMESAEETEEIEEETTKKLLAQGYTEEEIEEMLISDYDDLEEKVKFNYECFFCGYKVVSTKLCIDFACPKCGGKMRREERVGPGKNEDGPDEILFDIDPLEDKPYKNEFSCRLNPPSKYDSFVRSNCYKKHDGKCIDYIFGIKNGKSEVQALRYKKKIWTKSAAQDHCKIKNGSFEA